MVHHRDMRMALAAAVLLLGCATTSEVVMAPESPPPPAPTIPPPDCRGSRSAPNVAVVSCRFYGDPEQAPDWVWERFIVLSARVAAVQAVSSGRTHFAWMSSRPVSVQRPDYTTPVRCADVTPPSRRAAAGAANAMNAYNHSLAVSQSGAYVPPPAPVTPREEFQCYGGDTVTGPVQWVDFERVYELLSGEEAGGRTSPLIPAGNRPYQADALLAVTTPEGGWRR